MLIMKKVIFVAATIIMGVNVVSVADAQRLILETPSSVSVQTEEKVKIKTEELPDAVKKALESESFKSWKVQTAYYNKTKDTYEVEVKSGAEAKTLKFTKEGALID
jgi:hypothetical protein